MKSPMAMLEFGISGIDDIRSLIKAWKRYLGIEGLDNTKSILVYVTVNDRQPEEEVFLRFCASQEVLDRFLDYLGEDGFQFSCTEFIPGLLTICRVEPEGW